MKGTESLADLSQLTGKSKLLAGAITLLALVALGISTYLTWVTWQQSTIFGCTGGAAVDCDEVLSSSGSKWLGIPVSLCGALTYLAILALVWPAAIFGGWAMTGLLAVTMLAAGAGVWFIGNQAFIVQHFCLYCLAVHVCGLVICSLTIVLMRSVASESNVDHMHGYFSGQEVVGGGGSNPVLQPLIAAGLASVGLVALIAGQVFFAPAGMQIVEDLPVETVPQSNQAAEQPAENNENNKQPNESGTPAEPAGELVVATDQDEAVAAVGDTEPPKLEVVDADETEAQAGGGFDEELFAENTTEAPRFFRFKYLGREIDAAGNPVLGNPYALHRFVEMMDYTCPHCRKLHPFIKASVERYGDQLGFMIYHVPLSRKCNQLVKVDQASHRNACEYARLAYGVWKLAPDKFAEFHDWLLEGEKAPAINLAKKRAMELAGEAIFLDKTIETQSNKRVAASAAELEPLQTGLPVLIFEKGVIRGMPGTQQEWFEVLESRMGVKPVASAAN
jgi:uncharacterized membrane protein/protein-disulfide isomerase